MITENINAVILIFLLYNNINMNKINIIITGICGFIGSSLAIKMSDQDIYNIIGIDEMNDYYDINIKENNIQVIKKKNSDFSFYRETISQTLIDKIKKKYEKIDYIIHLGAWAGVRKSIECPLLYSNKNIDSIILLLELAKETKCNNFVFASSSSVYGEQNNCENGFDENYNVDNPISPYAFTKKANELYAHVFSHLYNLKTTGLRFFTVYGPNCRPDMAPYKFINRIMNGLPIEQYGDGTSARDYTYIDDIIDGILKSLDRKKGNLYEIYNLGNSNPVKLSDFIDIVSNEVGKKALVKIIDKQEGDVNLTYANISKAKDHFDYNPKTDFRSGIRKTVKYFKKKQMSICVRGIFSDNEKDNENIINNLKNIIETFKDNDIYFLYSGDMSEILLNYENLKIHKNDDIYINGINEILDLHIYNPKYIMFISLEVKIDKDIVNNLQSYFDEDTIVVGLKLKYHNFAENNNSLFIKKSDNKSLYKLSGLTIPWNTCAIWNFKYLIENKFVSVDNINIMGEVKLICKCLTEKKKVKIIDLDLKFELYDPNFIGEQLIKHNKKIETKDSITQQIINSLQYNNQDLIVEYIKENNINIGISGIGFVGSAMMNSFIINGYRNNGLNKNLFLYDPINANINKDITELLKVDILFLCLPTQYDYSTGEYNKSCIYENCEFLNSNNFKGAVIIKSTVEPEITNSLQIKFPNLNLIHNAEFLKAKTALYDMHNSDQIVLGKSQTCNQNVFENVIHFYKKMYKTSKISICTSTESEIMKIACNTFYAMKIQYFTELYGMCEKINQNNNNICNFQKIKDMMISNNRINPSDTTVPGPDGKISYGGLCYPKDTNALCKYMKQLDIPHEMIEAMINERNQMRDDHDNCNLFNSKK